MIECQDTDAENKDERAYKQPEVYMQGMNQTIEFIHCSCSFLTFKQSPGVNLKQLFSNAG